MSARKRAPRVVFLVPRRRDGGHRDKLWTYCRARWEKYFGDIPVIEGHHEEGSFNRSAAINRAAREAGDWDLGIVIDSDVMLGVSSARAAIERARETGKVTWGHRRWRGFHEDWTTRWVKERRDFGPELDRDLMDLYVERTNPLSWSCFMVIPRTVFDDMGGFDERFAGWGFEDMAFQSIVSGLYGYERIDGDIIHLWHPRSDERIILGRTRSTASDDYIRNGLLGRRYMLALRRDHEGHDRGDDKAGEVERERDIRNLRRDDAKFLQVARQREMPEAAWGDWWPTLVELRDGAIEYRRERERGSVTVILHTGGQPENWPQRREYLKASLDSLSATLSGPIVQRVIYDCWADPAIRAELEAIGQPHGFYVVGPIAAVDFTGSMRAMWTYLGKRARGEYIFQVEDDFTYERPIDLDAMIAVLRDQPHVVQMALLRDACYADERETGGILGWPLPAFTFHDGWFEHRQFWTNNPSLFRRSLTARPWPTGKHSETLFGKAVLADPAARAAFWGAGEEWIRHIGEVRAGTGY